MNEQQSPDVLSVVDFAKETLDATAQKAHPVNIPKLCEGSSYAEKCKVFNDAIVELSSCELSDNLTNEELEEFVRLFKMLYREGDSFRHRYSDVCAVIFGSLSSEDEDRLDEAVPPQAIILSNNIVILENVAESQDIDAYALGCIRKLHDHIDLEINRIKYMATQNKTLYAQDEGIRQAVSEKIEDTINRATVSFNNKIDKDIKDTQEKLQRNYVAILGIFAAIVIAFMSGSMFSSAVLQNMGNISIYRLSFVVLLLGFILFNLLSALFIFLSKLTKTWNKWMPGIIIATDIVLVALMVCDVVVRCLRVFG